jgi:hypothetical protein
VRVAATSAGGSHACGHPSLCRPRIARGGEPRPHDGVTPSAWPRVERPDEEQPLGGTGHLALCLRSLRITEHILELAQRIEGSE